MKFVGMSLVEVAAAVATPAIGFEPMTCA